MADMIVQEFFRSIVDPLAGIVNGIIMSLPGIIAAIIVLLVGYIVGLVIGKLVHKGLDRIDFDKWVVKKTHLAKTIGDLQLSYLVGIILKWWVFVLFLPPAATLVKLEPLAYFLAAVGFFIPNAIVALLIVFIGLIAANYLSDQIKKTKAKGAATIAGLAKVIALIFAFIIALEQLGIRIGLAKNAFLIILAGIVLGLSIAVGVSFGMGGKDQAKAILKKTMKKV